MGCIFSTFKPFAIIRLFVLLLCFTASVSGQNNDKLFGPKEKVRLKKGFMINGNIEGDLPGGDLAKEFGRSVRGGPAIMYKTSQNWLFGAKCDFITGNNIKVDSLCINIRDKYSNFTGGGLLEFINNGGQREGVPIYERGYLIGLSAGKIFSSSKTHPDNGLVLLTSVGFIQHKINIYNDGKDVMSIRGTLLKGYDRLTNGSYIEQYAGYIYFSRSQLINCTIGLDALFALTRDRREYLYDVMRSDNKQRIDMLFGVRFGWFFTIFKRKSEELSFQ